MKKLILSNLLVFLIAFGMFFSFRLGTTQAQMNSLTGVYPFFTSAGYMGFLDTNNGMFYLYDSDLTRCMLQKQITELGKPAITIKNEFQEKGQGVY